MHGAGLTGFAAGQKIFDRMARAFRPSQLAGAAADHGFHQSCRPGKRRWILLSMQSQHDVAEQRRSAGDAADAAHGGSVEIAHPNAHGVLLSITDGPIIAKIFAGAGFSRAGKRQSQRTGPSERRRPGLSVAQDIAEQPGDLFRKNRPTRLRLLIAQPDEIAVAPLIGQRDKRPR
ncbi:MAG: hypothetical protein BWY83_01913 [bacterium ADurb.Bin478]|nr:MAG: hypothetical protein BWY83_01913 [bacterium ADurb.Bin478]